MKLFQFLLAVVVVVVAVVFLLLPLLLLLLLLLPSSSFLINFSFPASFHFSAESSQYHSISAFTPEQLVNAVQVATQFAMWTGFLSLLVEILGALIR